MDKVEVKKIVIEIVKMCPGCKVSGSVPYNANFCPVCGRRIRWVRKETKP